MELEGGQKRKLAISILLVTSAAVYLSNFYLVPTNYAREVYFYAEYFVSGEILTTGHLPNTAPAPSRWGKIGTVNRTPVLPVFLSIYSLVLDVPVSIIYTLFPSVPLVTISMMAVLRRWGLSLPVSALLSGAGAITFPATVVYLVTPRPIGLVLTFSAVLLVVIFGVQSARQSTTYSQHFAYILLISLFFLYKFFRYPPALVSLAVMITIVGVLALAKGRLENPSEWRPVAIVSLLAISVLISLLIFELPLPNYVSKIKLVILNVAGQGTINPVSAYTGSSPTAYSTAYYSLLPIPILLPLAVVGGVYTIFDLWRRWDIVSIVAVSWGAMTVLKTAIYIITSEGWLVTRGYFFALPVMFLGASRYLREKRESRQLILASALLVVVILMMVLQFSYPPAAIQTYEPGIKSGSQWGGEYVDGPIQTDHKLGSPIAAEGNFNAFYPRTNEYELTRALFYDDYDKFNKRVDGFVMYSEGMTEYGLRAGLEYHKPMSDRAYAVRMNKSSRVYTNGEVSIVNV